jgi:hypothetical protein
LIFVEKITVKENNMRKRKKKKSALDKYVVFCLINLLVFTYVIMFLIFQNGNDYSTLITCFFATFGGEIFSCAVIKSLKIKEGEKNEQRND